MPNRKKPISEKRVRVTVSIHPEAKKNMDEIADRKRTTVSAVVNSKFQPKKKP